MTLSLLQRFTRTLGRFQSKLFPDRRRRQHAWLYLRKAAAVWLNVEPSTVWLHCDQPFLYDGSVVPLFGSVQFKGWALATRGIASVSYYYDGVFLGEADYGIPRPDVATLAGHLRQSFRTGFHFQLDTHTVPAGLHRLTLTARSRDGRLASDSCMVLVAHPSSDYESWRRQAAVKPAALAWMRRHAAALPVAHRISLFMRLPAGTDRQRFDTTVSSLRAQPYPHWQLCITCDKPVYEGLSEVLATAIDQDARIAVWVDPFAAAENAPTNHLDRAGGEWIGVIDPGDLLEPDALFEVVYYLNRHPECDLVYSDQDTVLERGRSQPVFRPDWSKDSAAGSNPLGRLWVVRRKMLRAVGGFGVLGEDAAEAALLQRLADQAREVGHVKSVLYGRWHENRPTPPPLVQDQKTLPSQEPLVLVQAPYPLVDRTRVRRILTVLLDHLGDVLLVFPALERLRQLFPDAQITALVGSWSAPLVRACPSVDQLLTFDFFEPSSSLPHKLILEDERRRIGAWLAGFGFDLAVDFRREPETREFLLWSGAWYTAGFANVGRFEWLTVALPCDYNVQRRKARRHVSQELLQLVEMIALVGRSDVCPQIEVPAVDEAQADEVLQPLLPADARLLVAIHPGSGRSIKCWPAESFARLADQLTEQLGATVVFLGAADEVPLVESILGQMRTGLAAVSVAGRLGISQLLAALARFDLFVGNDSGPTHMAAALGLPTLCICSGTVDPTQWAPLGPAALTIHRRLLCSPCYLRNREECPFGVACLRDLAVEDVWEAALRALLPRWQQRAKLPDTSAPRLLRKG
jgi:ADP-heptose:LPS heptosyltransferase